MPRAAFTETEVEAGRARILAAAHKIVGSDGLDALSMRSLAEAVALTPGALYRYFVNKDQVIEAVFGGGTALDDRLLAIANSRVSDLNAVRQALQAYADFAFEDEVRFRSLFLKHYGPGGRAFHACYGKQPSELWKRWPVAQQDRTRYRFESHDPAMVQPGRLRLSRELHFRELRTEHSVRTWRETI